ncbi:hypothetical protein Leryth_012373 [Lithospermum erythrorhizon]|nr:hypothetical protein Leryth_012373 [Lithospermum erythrorhizon]
MSRLGFGPRLLGQFSGGRVEEFIQARTLSADDLRDTEISALIASKVRELHELDMPGPRNVVLWDRLRTWLSIAKRICSVEHMKEFRLDELGYEIKGLENKFSFEQKIGFCHNDLQYGNIMIDDKTLILTFIDYEYASYNPVTYDIANHFCEMGAIMTQRHFPMFLDCKISGLEERHRLKYVHTSSYSWS